MHLERFELLERLAVALALGLLIGLERGWERRELPEGERVAGFRTFGLISLLGAITVSVAPDSEALLFAAMAGALGLAVAIGYWRESERSKDLSLTTTIAALVAFALGALAGRGELTAAAAAAVVVTLVLGFKPELHGMLEKIERPELLATLRLLLITVVLLPILPDRGFGPWAALNPYRIWWMVVLVAVISYVGYFGIRLLGKERGLLFAALCGGLVSSTVIAADFARLGRDRPEDQRLLAAGVVLASATMFPRMLVLAVIVAPELAQPLIPPLLAAGAVAFAAAALYAWPGARDRTDDERPEHRPLRNPLDLSIALRFGVLLATIMILARAALVLIGDRGLYALAGISGLIDVDAITLSIATMAKHGEATLAVAGLAILIPAAVNTVVKGTLVAGIAGFRMGATVAGALLAALAAGAATLLLFPLP